MTAGVVKGLKTLNPYIKTEAETIAWSEGVKSMENNVVGNFIVALRNDAYTKVRNVDFRENGPSKFTARVGTTHNGNVSMEVRLGARDGKLICTVNIPLTGGNDRWELVSTEIEKIMGVHDVYFIFKGRASGSIMFFDYWMFSD